jgi:type II secretory ATPase GspE/PulE/Tfp pilus assembly ATPase PilB-like protein
VFETAVVDEKAADVILSGSGYQQIRDALSEAGIHSALRDGLIKAAQGVTSIDEIFRIYAYYEQENVTPK